MVALKEVRIKENITAKQYKEVVNEVKVMKKIKHPNIIQLYDSFIDRQIDNKTIRSLREAQKRNSQYSFNFKRDSQKSEDGTQVSE